MHAKTEAIDRDLAGDGVVGGAAFEKAVLSALAVGDTAAARRALTCY